MKKYNFLCSLLVVVFSLCFMVLPVSASADNDLPNEPQVTVPGEPTIGNIPDSEGGEGTETNDDQTLYESLFGFDIANGSFAELDVSSFFEMADTFDMGAFSQLKYEIPSTETDAALLNSQYLGLLENMQASGYGTQYSITIPEFSVGYSSDIKANFQEVYGEVTSIGGFTMADVMNSTEESRHQRLQNLVGGEVYNVIYDNISLGRVVHPDTASDALTSSGNSLFSGSSLKDFAMGSIPGSSGSSHNSNKDEWPDGLKSDDEINDWLQGARDKYITTTPEELEAQFNSNKGDAKQRVETGLEQNLSEIEDWYITKTKVAALRTDALALVESLAKYNQLSESQKEGYINRIESAVDNGDIESLQNIIANLKDIQDSTPGTNYVVAEDTNDRGTSYCGGVGGWSNSPTGPYYGHYSYTNP